MRIKVTKKLLKPGIYLEVSTISGKCLHSNWQYICPFVKLCSLCGRTHDEQPNLGLKNWGNWDEVQKKAVIRTEDTAKELGKLGGEATKKKLGKEHFKRISKLGVKARSEKLV